MKAMIWAKRILTMLLVVAVLLPGGLYGPTLSILAANVSDATDSVTSSCDQCSDRCDGALPRCRSNARCNVACPQPAALPSVALAFWSAALVQLQPLPVSGFAGSVPRPDPPPPRA